MTAGAMERQSRTWLCTVVFLDLVGYTQRPVTQQVELKQRLQRIIGEAVAGIPKSECIIVDTGDGAALCFLGDPEEALFVALNVRDRVLSESALVVRIGINLGPVKVVKSLSGQQNPLGDGINNAERIMSFAEPNQILVSRSFYDVVACLSQEYAQLFRFAGMRQDKHIKEHTVYEVRVPEKERGGGAMEAVVERTEQEQARKEQLIALAWDPAVLKRAEQDLAQYIGPLAKVLVGRAARQSSTTTELYQALADMIPEGAERSKFLAHMPSSAQPGSTVPAGAILAADNNVPGPAKQSTGAQVSSDPELLHRLEQHLAVFLGPVSKVLVKKAAQKTADPQELCRLLANELSSPEQQASFLNAVRRDVSTKPH